MVSATPGRAPFLASFPALLLKNIISSGIQRGQPPPRRPPVPPPPRRGARPFPAVCCHLPSAAAGGGSRGASRSRCPDGGGEGGLAPAALPSLAVLPRPRPGGDARDPGRARPRSRTRLRPAALLGTFSYTSGLKTSGGPYTGCSRTYMRTPM